MIIVGTSGFSFPDWVGNIYPANIKKGDMLPYYEQKLGFKITEINSRYYTIPSQKSFEGMAKKTSPDFEFTVKAHKSMTHEIRGKSGNREERGRGYFVVAELFKKSYERIIGKG